MGRPFVVDGNSLATRCIMASATADLQAGGTFTGGLFTSIQTLGAVIGAPQWQGGPVYVFFDDGVPPHRLAAHPEYKATRADKEERVPREERYKQINAFRTILPALGVRTFRYREREADDGVAACARMLAGQGHNPIVVSGDKDLWQLVDDRISVLYLNEREKGLLTRENFYERVGVNHHTFLLWKLLIGDNSDNIEGVKGVGPAKASQLISEAIAEIDEASHGGYSLMDGDVDEQLGLLVDTLKERDKLRKFEQAVIDQAESVRAMIPVIDLSDSFGGTNGMLRKMLEPVGIDQQTFKSFCQKWSFKRYLATLDRTIEPYRRAAQWGGDL